MFKRILSVALALGIVLTSAATKITYALIAVAKNKSQKK
jgi:hypothetical protein